MEVASRDTSYLSVRHIFQHFFFLFSSISSYDALLHVTRFWRGEEREKVGERNGRGAKRLRVAEVVGDVVSRV